VRKTDAANATTLTTLQSPTELSFTLAANTTYTFDYFIVFQSASTGSGIALAVNGPASPTLISYTVNIPQAASDGKDAMLFGWGTALNDQVVSIEAPAAATNLVARIHGVIRTGASGGTLLPRFRTEESGQSVSIRTYSWGALYTS
jgi:hypothetical protein